MRGASLIMRTALPACLASLSATGLAELRGPLPGLNANDAYFIYYGNWNTSMVDFARQNFRIVILEPSSNITPAQIDTIRRGPDGVAETADDVLVFAYLSIGEDHRTGVPRAGDGTGPRVDPRPSGSTSFSYIAGNDAWLGLPSPGGTGYESFYLDDNDRDGIPDSNPTFGAYYVNPGDPAWYEVITHMTRATDGRSGLNEILTSEIGAGLNCDGVFLDTIDTPAPNAWGATQFEWTTPGFERLMARMSGDYPDALIIGNRGLFFLSPNYEHYEYTLRPHLNGVMFESYYTDADNAHEVSPFFASSRYDIAPKVNAESDRPDGYTVLALGYNHPPSLPEAVREQDFVESQREQGWMLYRSNISLSEINTDALAWNAANPDTAPPVWDSTILTGGNSPTEPRVGIQQAIPGNRRVTLRWDVARDQSKPVRYHVYHTTDAELDFATAERVPDVETVIPADYLAGTGRGRFPYEYTITGLENGVIHRFAVRAEDSAPVSHEETNTVTLTAIPHPEAGHFALIDIDGDFSDWADVPVAFIDDPGNAGTAEADITEVAIANDEDFIYLRIRTNNAADFLGSFRNMIFFDTDGALDTGFETIAGIGSEMMIQGMAGYDQRGGGFNEGVLDGLDIRNANASGLLDQEIAIPRSATHPDGTQVFGENGFRLALTSDNPENITGQIVPPGGYYYTFADASSRESNWLLLH